jgi:hypothetical protein
MPKALHKNKWRKIRSIEKCDDGYSYQLDGIEGKVYHKDIDDLNLSKYEIVNPDGSITRGPGKEPLRKPMKKSLLERWELLKAQISHEMAFMPMREDDEEQEQSPPSEGAQDPVPSDADQTQAPVSEAVDQTQQPIEDPDAQDASDAVDVSSLQGGAETDAGADEVEAPQEGKEDHAYDEEKLINLLRQDGYSDSEIAHIVHGHVPGSDREERAMNLEQVREQEKHDHHMDRLKGQTDTQQDHAKRMADLEYDHAKKEKELRLKHLEEELKIKLENLKNKGKVDGKAD